MEVFWRLSVFELYDSSCLIERLLFQAHEIGTFTELNADVFLMKRSDAYFRNLKRMICILPDFRFLCCNHYRIIVQARNRNFHKNGELKRSKNGPLRPTLDSALWIDLVTVTLCFCVDKNNLVRVTSLSWRLRWSMSGKLQRVGNFR